MPVQALVDAPALPAGAEDNAVLVLDPDDELALVDFVVDNHKNVFLEADSSTYAPVPRHSDRWAMGLRLLAEYPPLARVQRLYVPGKLEEDRFWAAFFHQLEGVWPRTTEHLDMAGDVFSCSAARCQEQG